MGKEKGLTLIALIITIIVMLIIIGVSIRIATNGGLFSNAKDAAQKNELRALQERVVSCYEMDAAGDLDCAKTKSNIQTSLSESGYNYTIQDTSGSLPITVCVTSKYDNYYKIVVKEDGITAEIVDDAIITSDVLDITLGFMHGDGDSEIPIAIIKTSRGVDCSETDFVNSANDFFTYLYNLYHLIDYIDSQYGLDDLGWIDNLTGVTSDEKEEIAQIVGYFAMVKGVKAGDVYDDIEDSETQNLDVLAYLNTKGIFETSSNAPITVNSFDDFLSFLDGHKYGYFDAFKVYMTMGESESSSSNDDPNNSNDPNEPNEQNNDSNESNEQTDGTAEMLAFVKDILDNNDISSMDNLYTALYNFDIESLEESITNDTKAGVLNFIQKDKMKKLLIIAFKNSADVVKVSGPYFASVGKIDATAKSYTDNMFPNYNGPTKDEILSGVLDDGVGIQADFFGYELKIGDKKITYSADTHETLSDMAQQIYMYSAMIGNIGGIVIVDPEVTVNYSDNDEITVSFGDFSATKTKAEWKLYETASEGE